MDLIGLGVQMMIYGIAGVFGVLIIFYFMIKILLKVFPDKG